jgi:hypothetical protein
MKVKEIAFLGDSFTWGEGLELYLDTPFWINQRNKKSWWSELKNIQTEESINFRESNRFANIVSKHFGAKLIIDDSNGGYIGNITKYLIQILNNNLKPDFVIIQFSSFVRNPIHYHLGCVPSWMTTSPNTECIRCSHKIEDGTIFCFYHLLETIRKKYSDNEELDSEHQFYLNWLNEEFNFKFLNLENSEQPLVLALNYIDSIIDLYSYFHLNYLITQYIKPLENRGIKVFYIDSWDEISSRICHNIPDIRLNMIYLNAWNSGLLTQNYSTFEKSFPHTRIQNEFPKTENGHPTILQHEYIAKSIINQIEKFDKKSFFKLF